MVSVSWSLGNHRDRSLIPHHKKRRKIPFPIQLKSVFYAKNRKKHSATGIYHEMLRGINRQGVFEEPEDYREGWNQKPLSL